MEKSLWQKGRLIRRTAFVVVINILMTSAASASDVGGSSGAYLRLPAGAAALGTGGAHTAAPEYYASFWNPAVLANLRERRAATGTGIRSLGRMDGYGSFEFRVPPRAAIGLFALYRGDPFLDNLHDPDENLYRHASYSTLTFKLALSYYIHRRVSAGLAINVFNQSLPLPGYESGGSLTYAKTTGIGSLDIALVYKVSEALVIAAVAKNLGAKMEWQMGDYSPIVEDKPLPEFVLGSCYTTSFAERPLLWMLDLKGYPFDGEMHILNKPEAVISTGCEWRRWENFYLRAGLGDLSITGDLVRNTSQYFDEYSMRVTAGFSRQLSSIKKGLWFNYGVATDKVWAGINQQLDLTLSF